MTRFTASAAQLQLFELLDVVEQGEEVVVERRGTRFRVVLDDARSDEIPPSPLIIKDPDVLAGNWTWQADENGQLDFQIRERWIGHETPSIVF